MYAALSKMLSILLDGWFRKTAREEGQALGIKHPLLKFSFCGRIYEGEEEQVLMDALWLVWTGAEGETLGPHTKQSASWLLFEDNRLYHYLCLRAGIDAKRLREHLMRDRYERELQELKRRTQ